jgi:hypothetical protein
MRADLARALGSAFLAGDWTRPGLVGSGSVVVRRRTTWLPALAAQVLEIYPSAPLDRPRELIAVIATRPAAERAGDAKPVTRRAASTRMVTNPWHLPVLHDLSELAARLGLTESGTGLVLGCATPVANRRRGASAALSGDHAAGSERRDPRGGGTQAATESDATPVARGGARRGSGPRCRPWFPYRPLGCHVRRAARRSGGARTP